MKSPDSEIFAKNGIYFSRGIKACNLADRDGLNLNLDHSRKLIFNIPISQIVMQTMPELNSIRIDKWLWTARFFKTRKLAADAVSGGKVHFNGQRCKPSKEVKVGVELSITKEPYSWDLTVIAINSHRRPAKEAVLLYEEETASVSQRQELMFQEKEKRSLMNYSEREHKPNKKQRRQIHRFKQG